jgi:hypothetical protein
MQHNLSGTAIVARGFGPKEQLAVAKVRTGNTHRLGCQRKVAERKWQGKRI